MITILRMRPNDAASLARLMHRAVHDGASRDYTPEQLTAWSPEPMDARAFLMRLADGRAVWVAFDADARACGFIELTPRGHIDLFYCHPRGQGIGGALYAALEAEARSRGLSRLTVNASEGAAGSFGAKDSTATEGARSCAAGLSCTTTRCRAISTLTPTPPFLDARTPSLYPIGRPDHAKDAQYEHPFPSHPRR